MMLTIQEKTYVGYVTHISEQRIRLICRGGDCMVNGLLSQQMTLAVSTLVKYFVWF